MAGRCGNPSRWPAKPIPEILEHLKSADDDIRYRARLELSGRESRAVADAAAKFAAAFDAKDIKSALPLTEALWLHQQHKIVNEESVKKSPRLSRTECESRCHEGAPGMASAH